MFSDRSSLTHRASMSISKLRWHTASAVSLPVRSLQSYGMEPDSQVDGDRDNIQASMASAKHACFVRRSAVTAFILSAR
jgi:hypothetical protein